MFPVELPWRCIKMHSDKGDAVIEPFCGSGTTIIACEELGRKCYAIERDPKYCDVTIRRWENFTGKKAELING
jgi:DNA modification methylase